ncbi:MAG: ribosomal protein S18-alanine N-acetyltransferase [Roseburia sp.]
MIFVRAMREEDVGAVAELEGQIFSTPWSYKSFLDSIRLSNTIFLVAEEEGKILGYIGMYLACGEGEITNVAVDFDERCRGVGGCLLAEMKKEAERRLIGSIVLEVRVSNRSAIRLYERNGFVNQGVRKDFYESPREDAYIMICGQ